MRKRPLKIRRESGRQYFEGFYYDEKGYKLDYVIIQWDDWNDWRDGFRFPLGQKYTGHSPSWKHLYKKRKQFLKVKPRHYKGFKRG